MRKALKVVSTIGSAALILSAGSAMAQINNIGVDFGTLSVESGSGTQCITGATCTVIAGGGAGEGFIQRQIDTASGSFIQTIIDDTAGGFASEDFVQMATGGGSTPGIASQLTITEGTPTTNLGGTVTSGFETTSTILAGWANAANNGGGEVSNVQVDLFVSDAGAANDAFASAFSVNTDFDAANPAAGNTVNSMQAEQVGFLGTANDKQHFFTEIKPADATGTAELDGNPATSVTWGTGDEVQIVWIGQAMPDAGVGVFGTTTVANNTAGTAETATSTTDTAPAVWPSEFNGGTAPTF
jgi:hypothetical protein